MFVFKRKAKFMFNAIFWYMAFLISVTIHEFMHGFVSYKFGDTAAYDAGLVTLNPYPHIRREFFGMVVVPFLSLAFAGWMIGWGSSPYTVEWAFRNPRKASLMALAGPLSNLALVVVSALAIRVFILIGLFSVPYTVSPGSVVEAGSSGALNGLATFLSVLFSLNILLFVFNMIPLPPMDGSSFPVLFMDERRAVGYMIAIRKPMFFLIGLFIAWQILKVIFGPVHLGFVNFLYMGIARYG